MLITETTEKIKLYKTAFFPLFNCYVRLIHAYQINGDWLFYVYNGDEGIGSPVISESGNFIARYEELNHFVL